MKNRRGEMKYGVKSLVVRFLGVLVLSLIGCGKEAGPPERRASGARSITGFRAMGLQPLTLTGFFSCTANYAVVLENLLATEQRIMQSQVVDKCSADLGREFHAIYNHESEIQIGGSKFFQYLGGFFSKEPGMACNLADPKFSAQGICERLAFAWPKGRIAETQMSLIPNPRSVEFRCKEFLCSKVPKNAGFSDYWGQAEFKCKEGNTSPNGVTRPPE